MKYTSCIGSMLVCFLTVSAFAGDGNVPRATLDSLGLASMEMLSDDEGMQIRGRSGSSGSAFAKGRAMISGFLIDPSKKSFLFGIDANTVMSNAANPGDHTVIQASTDHESILGLTLSIQMQGTEPFDAFLIGGAGGSASGWLK